MLSRGRPAAIQTGSDTGVIVQPVNHEDEPLLTRHAQPGLTGIGVYVKTMDGGTVDNANTLPTGQGILIDSTT